MTSNDFSETVRALATIRRARRKRTAARLWVMRRQLRDYAYALHPEIDLAERREAVQKVRNG